MALYVSRYYNNYVGLLFAEEMEATDKDNVSCLIMSITKWISIDRTIFSSTDY